LLSNKFGRSFFLDELFEGFGSIEETSSLVLPKRKTLKDILPKFRHQQFRKSLNVSKEEKWKWKMILSIFRCETQVDKLEKIYFKTKIQYLCWIKWRDSFKKITRFLLDSDSNFHEKWLSLIEFFRVKIYGVFLENGIENVWISNDRTEIWGQVMERSTFAFLVFNLVDH
jgi:hypothetical protein